MDEILENEPFAGLLGPRIKYELERKGINETNQNYMGEYLNELDARSSILKYGLIGSAATTGPGLANKLNPSIIGGNNSGEATTNGVRSLNPSEINFSQRTVNSNVDQYSVDMASGNWNWSKSGPLRVMNKDGQWVSYDNRRLMAAQQAGLDSVPVSVVKPSDQMPGRNVTWETAFKDRFTDWRNIRAGGAIPETGLSSLPSIWMNRR